jgi:hypothetical protein
MWWIAWTMRAIAQLRMQEEGDVEGDADMDSSCQKLPSRIQKERAVTGLRTHKGSEGARRRRGLDNKFSKWPIPLGEKLIVRTVRV